MFKDKNRIIQPIKLTNNYLKQIVFMKLEIKLNYYAYLMS